MPRKTEQTMKPTTARSRKVPNVPSIIPPSSSTCLPITAYPGPVSASDGKPDPAFSGIALPGLANNQTGSMGPPPGLVHPRASIGVSSTTGAMISAASAAEVPRRASLSAPSTAGEVPYNALRCGSLGDAAPTSEVTAARRGSQGSLVLPSEQNADPTTPIRDVFDPPAPVTPTFPTERGLKRTRSQVSPLSPVNYQGLCTSPGDLPPSYKNPRLGSPPGIHPDFSWKLDESSGNRTWPLPDPERAGSPTPLQTGPTFLDPELQIPVDFLESLQFPELETLPALPEPHEGSLSAQIDFDPAFVSNSNEDSDWPWSVEGAQQLQCDGSFVGKSAQSIGSNGPTVDTAPALHPRTSIYSYSHRVLDVDYVQNHHEYQRASASHDQQVYAAHHQYPQQPLPPQQSPYPAQTALSQGQQPDLVTRRYENHPGQDICFTPQPPQYFWSSAPQGLSHHQPPHSDSSQHYGIYHTSQDLNAGQQVLVPPAYRSISYQGHSVGLDAQAGGHNAVARALPQPQYAIPQGQSPDHQALLTHADQPHMLSNSHPCASGSDLNYKLAAYPTEPEQHCYADYSRSSTVYPGFTCASSCTQGPANPSRPIKPLPKTRALHANGTQQHGVPASTLPPASAVPSQVSLHDQQSAVIVVPKRKRTRRAKSSRTPATPVGSSTVTTTLPQFQTSGHAPLAPQVSQPAATSSQPAQPAASTQTSFPTSVQDALTNYRVDEKFRETADELVSSRAELHASDLSDSVGATGRFNAFICFSSTVKFASERLLEPVRRELTLRGLDCVFDNSRLVKAKKHVWQLLKAATLGSELRGEVTRTKANRPSTARAADNLSWDRTSILQQMDSPAWQQIIQADYIDALCGRRLDLPPELVLRLKKTTKWDPILNSAAPPGDPGATSASQGDDGGQDETSGSGQDQSLDKGKGKAVDRGTGFTSYDRSSTAYASSTQATASGLRINQPNDAVSSSDSSFSTYYSFPGGLSSSVLYTPRTSSSFATHNNATPGVLESSGNTQSIHEQALGTFYQSATEGYVAPRGDTTESELTEARKCD